MKGRSISARSATSASKPTCSATFFSIHSATGRPTRLGRVLAMRIMSLGPDTDRVSTSYSVVAMMTWPPITSKGSGIQVASAVPGGGPGRPWAVRWMLSEPCYERMNRPRYRGRLPPRRTAVLLSPRVAQGASHLRCALLADEAGGDSGSFGSRCLKLDSPAQVGGEPVDGGRVVRHGLSGTKGIAGAGYIRRRRAARERERFFRQIVGQPRRLTGGAGEVPAVNQGLGQ